MREIWRRPWVGIWKRGFNLGHCHYRMWAQHRFHRCGVVLSRPFDVGRKNQDKWNSAVKGCTTQNTEDRSTMPLPQKTWIDQSLRENTGGVYLNWCGQLLEGVGMRLPREEAWGLEHMHPGQIVEHRRRPFRSNLMPVAHRLSSQPFRNMCLNMDFHFPTFHLFLTDRIRPSASSWMISGLISWFEQFDN